MRPLTVLKVIDAWKWFAEAELMFQSSLALVGRGHRIEVACQPESPAAERARAAGLVVHPLPGLRRPRLPTTPPANVARLAAVVRGLRPDVVHAYRSPPHVLSALALRLVGAPRPALVRTRAGAQAITRNAANRLLYDRWTAMTLVSSERIRDDMIAGGFDRSRIGTLPVAIDPTALGAPDPARFRREVGLPAGAPVVGILGRMAEVKGHRHLIEALPELARLHPELRVCFVGPPADPGLPEALAGLARELGVSDRLVLAGPRDDPASALAAFDVVAVCSVGSEVISRVLLEAFALGRPVVATRVGVIPEIAEDERSALLVEPGDPAALAGAAHRLLSDGALATRLGRAAAAAVRDRHLPEHLADALEQAYDRAIG